MDKPTTERVGMEASGLDCLLVHVSKSQTYYPPLNVYQSCNRMSIGLLALAELSERHGYRVRVVHEGVERALDRRFSMGAYLRRTQPKAIGFSLQFHHGLVDTVRCVAEARAALPDAFIFLGGFTATGFARDILDRFADVDAVVRGDGEAPLLALLDWVSRGRQRDDLAGVPNLLWRAASGVVDNGQSYVADEEMLNELVFTRFDLMEHASMYAGMPKAFLRTNLPTALNLTLNRVLGKDRSRFFWGVPVGRGCVSSCFYCGGGGKAQVSINARHGVIFRKPAKVLETMRGLKAFGYTGGYLSFDPRPWSQDYYVELFRLMRREQVTFDLLFSGWALPTRPFLDEFAKTFGPNSACLVSPETGSERLRKTARAASYSNDDLFEVLDHAKSLGIRTVVYFSIGVPFETEQDFAETLALKETIRTRYPGTRIEAFLIEMEPGSPWHGDPEKYGVRLQRRSLDDFMRDHASAAYSSMTNLGYTSAFFGDPDIAPQEFGRRLLDLKCRHFCGQRNMCRLMCGFWAVCRAVGLVPRPRVQPVAAARTGCHE